MPAGSFSESWVITAVKLSENEFIHRIMDHDNHQLGSVFREMFTDFEQPPHPDVWKGLSRQLFLRRLLKITYTWVVPGLTVAALAFWLMLPKPENSQVPKPVSNPVIVANTDSVAETVSLPEQPQESASPAAKKEVVVVTHNEPTQKKGVQHPSDPPVTVTPEPARTSVRQSHPIVGSSVEKAVIANVKSPVTEKQPVSDLRVNHQAPSVTSDDAENQPPLITDQADVQVTETNYSICAGEEVSLTAPEGWRYTWGTGDFARSITVKPAESSAYEVTVEDRQGNRSVARFVVSILDCSIYVPRAFSPNDDGSNDQFVVRAEGISQFEMKVYSKWGELVFESRDISQGWDGRSRGVRAPVDAYIYQIRFIDEAGNWHDVQGTVTLIP